jgi:guanylate kinase
MFSVSATTRAPRAGEIDGRDYFFVTPSEFDRLIADGELLEWADIHGGLQRSGTPSRPVFDAMEQGRPTLVEVDLAGARNIRAAVPDAITVFLAPPSWEELVSRLRGRGTETDDAIERRLKTAKAELDSASEFDHVVVNDEVDLVAQQLVSLLVESHLNNS